MKTAPLLALSALLALSGCGASDDACFPTTIFDDSSAGPPAFRVDAPASLQVSALQTLSCSGKTDSQVPDSVTAEVFDPDNQLVPSEVELAVNGMSAVVRFTPKTTGRHHVLVAFAPVGSVQQLGVYVARTWSGSNTATTLPLPRCTQLDRTTRGTWLCDGVAVHADGRTQRLGTSTLAPDVAVAGNVVWVVGSEGRVRRFEDTGGTELELTGSLLLSTSAPVTTIQSRLATQNELWVLDSQRLHRFVFTEAGVLAAAGATTWISGTETPFGTDNTLGLLVRVSSERVLVVKMTPLADSQACSFQLESDGAFAATGEPCLPLRGTPVGYEDGVVWMRAGAPFQAGGQTLQRWAVSDGTLMEQGSLVLDSRVEGVVTALRAGFLVPDVRLGFLPTSFSVLPVVSASQGPLGLEILPGTASLASELRTVSPRFYWEGDNRVSGASTVVYERPAG
ncbi:hypothetical protein JY651_38085 [Pyxidicoccus parkwayensis]|uniref:Lipoprotein n=1 Tax=Pyxidicoccus parkwayensis TaxID=2813578 RepID=A0ABX7NQK2_9BACT|nr:hypothetical protein [Pyxidicoccus parkwaysis]QSQ20973.1 hypothetical protein JY651_38085 [Pyxidicoccus parkwaysis]